jgi:hypothetical protein
MTSSERMCIERLRRRPREVASNARVIEALSAYLGAAS